MSGLGSRMNIDRLPFRSEVTMANPMKGSL
jgi:hypothetical protein